MWFSGYVAGSQFMMETMVTVAYGRNFGQDRHATAGTQGRLGEGDRITDRVQLHIRRPLGDIVLPCT